jgi:CBS domain-containing protein
MNQPVVARDIMVTRLVTLTPRMDAHQAIGLLLKHRISGAPVIDDQRNYLGVFSEKGSMSMLLEAAYDGLPTSEIEPYLDCDAMTIHEDVDLLSIAQIFRETGHRRLPVLRDGKLVGQVSRRDVLRAAHDMMKVVPSRGEMELLYISSLVARSEAPIG